MNATTMEKKTATQSPATAGPAPSGRLMSLDALRGFDMFWIIGGGSFVQALVAWIGWQPLREVVECQTRHVGWEGFTAWDLIFPLFVFMSGVTMPFALVKQLERGESRTRLYGRLFRRMLLLVFLGMFVQGVLRFHWADTRFFSVLGLIGVSNFLGGMIVLHRPPRGQALWVVGILLGYWLALTYIPVPGVGAGVITPGGVVNAYIDQHLTPGRLHGGVFDPEGLIAMLPAAALVVLGALAGRWLRRDDLSGSRKAAGLFLGGGGLLLLGILGGYGFPVVKALWSSTFILMAAGWGMMLLASFYLVIDVWGWRWLGWVWVPIGMNAITIYILADFLGIFGSLSELCFSGLAGSLDPVAGAVVTSGGLVLVEWVFLYFLYRKKIFLRA